MQKYLKFLLIALIVLIIVVGGYIYYIYQTPCLGCGKDAHGCIGSAGYTWCEVKNKCLRVWEESCGSTPTNSQGFSNLYNNKTAQGSTVSVQGQILSWSYGLGFGGEALLYDGSYYLNVLISHASAGNYASFFAQVKKGDTVIIDGAFSGYRDFHNSTPNASLNVDIKLGLVAEIDDPSNMTVVTTNQTAGWKTYTNTQYKFSIKYPSNWTGAEQTLTMSSLGDLVYFKANGLYVNVWNTSTYSYDQLKAPPPGGIDQIKQENITIDGYPATKFSYVSIGDANSGTVPIQKVSILKTQLVYVIECHGQECDQMLSTFKFTK